MTNGKSKGSGYERTVAKFLTEWASGQDKDYWFWRTSNSGGTATMSGGRRNAAMSGDIKPEVPEAEFMSVFSIEAKRGYPDASFDKHLLERKNNTINGFWKQCVRDADTYEKQPMLIYKKDRVDAWVAIGTNTYKYFQKQLDTLKFVHLKFDDLPDAYAFDMDKFFKLITADMVREYSRVTRIPPHEAHTLS